MVKWGEETGPFCWSLTRQARNLCGDPGTQLQNNSQQEQLPVSAGCSGRHRDD